MGERGAPADQYDSPLGGLPSPSRVQLTLARVEAASAEVRFVPNGYELTQEVGERIRRGLGESLLPLLERAAINVVSVTITPDGADQSVDTQHGWKFSSSDRSTAVSIMPAMVLVQTTRYERFSVSFAPILARALELFTDETNAELVQRIGLRYVNRLRDADVHSPQDWVPRIRAPFAGTLSSDWSGLVEQSLQATTLRLDATAGARVQNGVIPEDGSELKYSYLVDIDVFREQTMPFNPSVCADHTRQLNRTALALFAQVLSPSYFNSLGPRREEAS